MKLKLFKYSGGKSKLVQKYRFTNCKRIVEPFAGSMAFSLNHNVESLGIESNKDIVDMWAWLKAAKESDLRDLDRDFKTYANKNGFDVRSMNLPIGPQTYVRLNTTGVVTGQLFAWKVYPQHKLPIEDTIKCLPHLSRIEMIHGDGMQFTDEQLGDLFFIDPPYFGTKAGYFEKSKNKSHEIFNSEIISDFIDNLKSPVIFTYGNGASDIYPSYNWEDVAERKVPKIRSGGCSIRKEHVAYIRMLFA